ncbi:hypothetical protein C3B44_00040 [Corynebacterium yudongzhengii]|uniref:Uncharacterized protein n=1 Tax=Corynebacterium yudongzhengii TaxID=2080740 RepID=A0A2U1T553_9CORY|nr:hypothetical protein [Corynebacterium yudongzhengii]AWB80937.1 hypothetical protein C3B44_00040 [Corynebacterium yudongzhengii]PWC01137.1 hypothetical protein DF222_09205 [Corynebacterium yudongzhengii]
MSHLALLLESERRRPVIRDLAQLIDKAVTHSTGLRARALKTGLHAAQRIRADLVPEAIDRLLPDVLGDLEHYWQSYEAGSRNEETDFGSYLAPHTDEVAASLVSTADGAVDRVNNRALVKIYHSLRARGGRMISPHVPELGRVVERHMRG